MQPETRGSGRAARLIRFNSAFCGKGDPTLNWLRSSHCGLEAQSEPYGNDRAPRLPRSNSAFCGKGVPTLIWLRSSHYCPVPQSEVRANGRTPRLLRSNSAFTRLPLRRQQDRRQLAPLKQPAL